MKQRISKRILSLILCLLVVEEETAIETVAKDKAETGMPYWLIVVIIVAVIAVAVVGIVFGIRFFKKKSEDGYYFDEEDEETVE